MEPTTITFTRAAAEECAGLPCSPAPESVHDLDSDLLDTVDLSSAESMIASDPPSFTPVQGAGTDDNLAHDERIKAGQPISPYSGKLPEPA